MGNKAKWRSFSKEEISEIVQTSYSNREVARKLGYAVDSGGGHDFFKEDVFRIRTGYFSF